VRRCQKAVASGVQVFKVVASGRELREELLFLDSMMAERAVHRRWAESPGRLIGVSRRIWQIIRITNSGYISDRIVQTL